MCNPARRLSARRAAGKGTVSGLGQACAERATLAKHPVGAVQALGMVMQLPEKDATSVTRRQLTAMLDVCMGGRVAEELIFGDDDVTTGARPLCNRCIALL